MNCDITLKYFLARRLDDTEKIIKLEIICYFDLNFDFCDKHRIHAAKKMFSFEIDTTTASKVTCCWFVKEILHFN